MYATMAPSTRSTLRPSALSRSIRACEANTIGHHFFELMILDKREIIRAIAATNNITFRTANQTPTPTT